MPPNIYPSNYNGLSLIRSVYVDFGFLSFLCLVGCPSSALCGLPLLYLVGCPSSALWVAPPLPCGLSLLCLVGCASFTLWVVPPLPCGCGLPLLYPFGLLLLCLVGCPFSPLWVVLPLPCGLSFLSLVGCSRPLWMYGFIFERSCTPYEMLYIFLCYFMKYPNQL